jgi:hypothetical protein
MAVSKRVRDGRLPENAQCWLLRVLTSDWIENRSQAPKKQKKRTDLKLYTLLAHTILFFILQCYDRLRCAFPFSFLSFLLVISLLL